MFRRRISPKKLLAIVGIGLLVLVAGCASGAVVPASAPQPVNDEISPGQQNGAAVLTTPIPQNDPAKQVQQKRLVIKNATLQVTVDDVQASLASISSMASEMTGWIVASKSFKTTYNGVDAIQATISIRVPAERFDEALTKIKSGAKSVDREDVSGDDVTKQYTDLVSQQTNLEAAETKLREIMDAAKDTKDVLDVYNELVKVRGEIEQIKGQIKFYEESAAFSSISVTLMPPEAPRPIVSTGWRPLDTARDAFATLLQFGQELVNLVIWLVIFVLPLGIVVGIPAWLGWRIRRRYSRPKQPAAAPSTPKEIPNQPDPEQ